jgi:superfamily II DNA or RNA helicase
MKQITLRPYQERAINEAKRAIIEGNKRLILCKPTGAGKTITFTAICKSAMEKGSTVLIVTDRTELLMQAGGALNAFGMKPEQIKPGKEPDFLNPNLYTAMAETLKRRLKKDARYQNLMKRFDIIIFDEAHKQVFNRLFEYISDKTIVIGATATPYRDRGMRPLIEDYDTIIEPVTISSLIDEGYLAYPRTFNNPVDLSQVKMKGRDYDTEAMGREYSRQKVWAGVIENYNRITPGKKALLFASNIKGSIEMCEQLQAAGLPAKHLDGTARNFERTKTLAWYRNTPGAILCNVGLFTTGFDAPETEVVILYRATKSLPLFLQMVGRGSRVVPGKKEEFFILDFGDNTREHGLWETDREWSLHPPKKRSKKQDASPVKECPECQYMMHTAVRSCPECGYEFVKSEEEELEERIAQLVEVPKRERLQIAKQAESLEELAAMAKAKAIKPFWVLHNLIDNYEDADRFRELMGWKKGWWHHNQGRFPHLVRRKKAEGLA